MAWTHYSLKFRLLSPMHIGYRKVGNLMQTRYYVPGKNIWAALTARLTRDHHDGKQGKEYTKIGNYVQENFRFSYLWPSLDEKKPYFPWEHEEDFCYSLLDGYASAALDYSSYSTEEGSLHETEFIAPVARNGLPVYLLGDLWAKNGIDARDWQTSMNNLQLGGERTYGWGRLALCSDWEGNSSRSGKTVTFHEWREKDGKIILTLNQGEKITSHALAYGEGATKDVAGPVEPLVGRDWGEHAGQNTPFEKVYFSPGSRVKEESEANRKIEFEIGINGRWRSF
jgi:hypothetical protein